MAGNVAVRFSVEDQEVVRKALEDLGAQGNAALKKMDDAAKSPTSGMKALSNVVDEFKSRLMGLAVPLGPLGSGLIALGPGGIAAAAGIGAVITTLAKLNELANEFATKSSKLSNFSELTGLTTDQVQALNNATVKYGKSAEDTNTVIERSAQAWDQLRRGQGDAFDQIRKIDPALLSQLASAKDLASALDILAKAYDKAGDESAKIALARAFGGKGGASTLSAVLGSIIEAGGFGPLTKEMKEAGSVIDNELIQRLTKLQAQIKDIKERTSDKFGALFSENALQHNKEVAQDVERIVDGIKYIKDNAPSGSVFNAPSGQQRNPFIAETNSGARNKSDTSDTIVSGGLSLSGSSSNRGTRSGREGDLDNAIAPGDVRIPQPRPEASAPAAAGVPLAVQLRNMRDLIGLLGSAATSTEQYSLKELELKKAVDDKSISDVNAARALAAFKMAQDQATEGMRERLGIATEDNIVQARMAQLRDARTKGIIQSDEEFARAEQLVQREARQTAEAMEVRNSSFKGLKQLEIDGRDLSKTLDQGLTTSLGSVNSGLADILDHTKSAGVGFTDLGKIVVRSALEMATKMAITSQVALLLQRSLSAFGIGGGGLSGVNANGSITGAVGATSVGGAPLVGSAFGNVFSGGNIIPFRAGGVIRRPTLFPMANGGTGLAGEAGEEGVFPLTRINGKLGVLAAGGGSAASPPGVQVHLHGVENSQNVRTVQSVDGRGNQRIDVMLDRAIAANLARPGSDTRRAMGSSFGAKPIGPLR